MYLTNDSFKLKYMSLDLYACSSLPDNHEWITSDWKGLEARYEHCGFVSESCPQCLWVFGGAQQTGNRKCIQKLQLSGKSCLKILF